MLEGAVVVITGASSGIGRAAAHAFDRRGAKLVLASRSVTALDELARGLANAIAVPTDITDAHAVQRLVRASVEHFGRLDVLINNAGRAILAMLTEIDVAAYRAILELNTVAPIVAMQAAIPQMRAQGGGIIVNVTSGTATAHIPGLAGYASSKAALASITGTAAKELAADRIVVAPFDPGPTATSLGTNALRVGSRDPRPAAAQSIVPQSPEAVAERLAQLVGDVSVAIDLADAASQHR